MGRQNQKVNTPPPFGIKGGGLGISGRLLNSNLFILKAPGLYFYPSSASGAAGAVMAVRLARLLRIRADTMPNPAHTTHHNSIKL